MRNVNPAIMPEATVITGEFGVSGRSSLSDPYLTFSEVRVRRLNVVCSPVTTDAKSLRTPFFTPGIGMRK
jgi:hypothetical protein